MSTNTSSGTGQTWPSSSRSSRTTATPYRGVAMTAGVMYLITIVASIPAQFINYAPILNNPDYVLGAGADTRVMWGGLLEVIAALACIGTAVVLYPVVRRQHEGAGRSGAAALCTTICGRLRVRAQRDRFLQGEDPLRHQKTFALHETMETSMYFVPPTLPNLWSL